LSESGREREKLSMCVSLLLEHLELLKLVSQLLLFGKVAETCVPLTDLPFRRGTDAYTIEPSPRPP